MSLERASWSRLSLSLCRGSERASLETIFHRELENKLVD